MIPSVVASEVLVALGDFLRTGFGPSTSELAHVVDDFLANPDNLAKGPYLSLALPFERAPEGGEPFPHVPLGFVPYKHQRRAIARLSPDVGLSTVVATGTGSGKTECFLFPILEHCRRQAGKKGIKAIVVYPMNALATDQARRIAQLVHRTPSLQGRVTAGLFIGQAAKSPHTRMGPENVVTDRAAMRDHPPDILLTNYKMLDYLLIRPRDRRLWRHNDPDTLRYLVVDELHTFDGAQGTDLACLIRRLRLRLGTSAEKLVCAGTSATLGNPREYVSRIFDQEFDADSIVGEERQSIDDFLGDALITGHLLPRGDLATVVDHRHYDTAEEYLRAQHELFMDAPIEGDFDSADWRLALGERLRQHVVFVNVLRALDGRPTPLPELAKRLRSSLPVNSDREALGVLNGLCALVSVARRAGDVGGLPRPFLQVGVHLWVRELRRMVCSVVGEAGGEHREPDEPAGDAAARARSAHALRHADDLKGDEPLVHLPLIQCRECRATGWVTKPAVGSSGRSSGRVLSARPEDGLRDIYGAFFGGDIDTTFLFPGEAPVGGRAHGVDSLLCGRCGTLSADSGGSDGDDDEDGSANAGAGRPAKTCARCRREAVVKVFRPATVTPKGSGPSGAPPRLSKDCPYCSAQESMVIFGARSPTMLAAALSQTVSSRSNDDAKVIAFSDNVQDAAHRAGFVSARTWRTNMRAAVAQTVADHEGISLADLPGKVVEQWQNRWPDPLGEDGAPDLARFVGEFIAPDRRWLNDFRELESTGRLPANSNLPDLVARRMRWDTLGEFGQRSAIGRTLENTRTAALGVDPTALTRACEAARDRLRQEVEGLRDAPDDVARALVLGVVRRMKARGAFLTDLVKSYLASGGNPYVLNRDLALPDYGARGSMTPVFPGTPAHKSQPGIETLLGAGSKSWYRQWTQKVLDDAGLALTAVHDADAVLHAVFRALESAGIARYVEAGNGRAWGLVPESLYVTTNVAEMRVAEGVVAVDGAAPGDGTAPADSAPAVGPAPAGRPLVVPQQETELWRGVPSLDLSTRGVYNRSAPARVTWFGRLYRDMKIRRIVAAEHTALLEREERERVQERFTASGYRSWSPNVLSATPTLELGIDVGDLSTVVLCTVPPAPPNYVQRTGRAGRRDGNAFSLAVAAGRSHDLYFYAEPLDMLAAKVEPPGVFLNARAVLERQMTAYCLDSWVAGGVDEDAVPKTMRAVLDNVERERVSRFPFVFFDHVQEHAQALAESFLAAFDEDLSDENKRELSRFLLGDAGSGLGHQPPSGEPLALGRQPLVRRLLDRFAEVAKERKSVRREIDALARRAGALRRKPQDDSTEAEIEDTLRERTGLQGVLRKINGRETYNFLTDEGLVPNYAFPEKGVLLRSAIFRRRERHEQAEGGDRSYEQEVFEYERPAAAALSEFAPENEFYAGARHVRIDRVDLETSKLEQWRLCPSCVYCERVDAQDDNKLCPRCGNPLWADAGQRRDMLPLRMVHATTRDRKSRIGDDSDIRQSSFYTRHLVADFEPDAAQATFAAEGSASFGFEYIPSATFREMNFGQRHGQGPPTRVAGVELPRDGFRICRRCGKVQSGKNEEVEHTRTCPAARRAAKDDDIAECIYLYREFSSEAIRMLVPGVGGWAPERSVHSFVAALELGLRRKFGGEIGHLRAMDCEYPIPGTSRKRKYLLLYDTVPGGTGYLKDRMTDPAKLRSVFEASLDALQTCECVRDPEKDGCYRCVFAYRRSRDMLDTSRREAERQVAAILERWDDLEEVAALENVATGSVLSESELEDRFLEGLRRVSRQGRAIRAEPTGDLPAVRIHSDQVGGKPGHVLVVGAETYYVEPQAELGMGEGVAVPSRPDFILRPARSSSSSPAVAVFLDGFEYHWNRIDDDTDKRTSLVRAGFVVWSLTWDDLERAFGGKSSAPDLLREATAGPVAVQEQLDASWHVGEMRSGLHAPSFDLLLHYLAEPDPVQWRRAVFAEMLGVFDHEQMTTPALRTRFDAETSASLPGQALEALADLPQPAAVGGFGPWVADEAKPGADSAATPTLFAAISLQAVQEMDTAGIFAALHLDDDEAGRDSPEYRRSWMGFLRLFNVLQFLPQAWWTTRSGVSRGLYPEAGLPSAPDDDALRYVAPELLPVARALASTDIPPPETGWELLGSTGEVVAEAELAWPDHRTAVLLPEQEDHRIPFEQAGWRVVVANPAKLAEEGPDALVKELVAALRNDPDDAHGNPDPPRGPDR